MNDLSDHHEYVQDEEKVQRVANVLVIGTFALIVLGFLTAPQASVSLPMFFAFIWAVFGMGMRRCPPVSITLSLCVLLFGVIVFYFGSVPAWQDSGFGVWWM